MTHLTADELIDAVEGMLESDRRAHLDVCDACQRAVADLAATLRTAQQVDVPEPSPLFWDHFSARVRQAVAAEGTPAGAGWWPALLDWRVLAPVAALAMIVLTVLLAMPAPEPAPAPLAGTGTAGVEPPDGGLPAPDTEGGWQLVAELVGTIDWETATEAGLGVRPGAAELAVFDLSADEQQELRRLLDAELKRPRS